MIEERFALSGGVKIRYLDNATQPPAGTTQPPAGRPVLFSTGVVDRAEDYLEMFDLWGHRRLVVVEARGRGGSDAPETGYSAAHQAGDLAAVVDDGRLGRFHLMTFSRGTTAGLLLAFDRPESVLTVSIGDYSPAEVPVGDALVERLMASRWRGSPATARITHRVLQAVSDEARPRELWDGLAGLGVPVLAVVGEHGVVNEEVRRRYLQRVPGAEVVVVPGAGHDVFRPVRSAYPAAVLEFIERRRPGT